MANAHLVDPQERFNAIDFDPRTEHWEHSICVSDYTCPECKYQVRFSTHDFYGDRTVCPFDDQQRQIIESARLLSASDREQCLDFLCPQCGLPVRAVYRPDSEFAMGAYTYKIVVVIELHETG